MLSLCPGSETWGTGKPVSQQVCLQLTFGSNVRAPFTATIQKKDANVTVTVTKQNTVTKLKEQETFN